jgi:outer membrane immunogenic protein
MTQRSRLLSTVAAAAVAVWLNSAQARAADPIVVDIYDWSGFYVGAFVGYGEADVEFSPHEFETEDGTADPNLNGILGGLYAGVNFQHDSFVFGLEADAGLTDWSDSGDFSDNSDREAEADIDFLASIRGRLGVAMDRTLIFATGGIAFADGEYTSISPGGTSNSQSEMSIGGVLGGGIEFAITDNMVVRGEGLYYIFDDEIDLGDTEDLDPTNRAELDDAFAVRLGLSFNF